MIILIWHSVWSNAGNFVKCFITGELDAANSALASQLAEWRHRQEAGQVDHVDDLGGGGGGGENDQRENIWDADNALFLQTLASLPSEELDQLARRNKVASLVFGILLKHFVWVFIKNLSFDIFRSCKIAMMSLKHGFTGVLLIGEGEASYIKSLNSSKQF